MILFLFSFFSDFIMEVDMEKMLKAIFKWISQIVQSVIVLVIVRNVMRAINAVIAYVKARIRTRKRREQLNAEVEEKLIEVRKEREQVELLKDQIQEYLNRIPVDPELKESVELCRSIGIEESRILHTKEEGDRFFMSDEAVEI